MSNFFKKITWQTLIPPVVFVLLGLILAIWPQSSIKAVCTVAALFMIAVGVVCLYCYFSGREDLFSGRVNLVCGVLMIAIAVWIITRSNYFLSLIPILAGVTVIVHGLVDLRQAILLRQARKQNWWITLLIALLALCLGCIMFLNPFETIVTIMRFIGIVLIAVGISDIFVLTQGVGSVPLPGRSRKASDAQRSKAKKSRTGARSSEGRQPMEDVPEKPARKAARKPQKSGGFLGDKLKSLNKGQSKTEKASRMSKLERVLGSAPDESEDLDSLDDFDSPDDFPADPEDFRIPESAASTSGEYTPLEDEDDEDDFWDDEEWDKL